MELALPVLRPDAGNVLAQKRLYLVPSVKGQADNGTVPVLAGGEEGGAEGAKKLFGGTDAV